MEKNKKKEVAEPIDILLDKVNSEITEKDPELAAQWLKMSRDEQREKLYLFMFEQALNDGMFDVETEEDAVSTDWLKTSLPHDRSKELIN